jgi:hypothetical protein
MIFSPHSLHPPMRLTDQDKANVRGTVEAHVNLLRQRLPAAQPSSPAGDTVTIQLTTVSAQGNFDAYINIHFGAGASAVAVTLLVDSGNSTLIIPEWEQIQSLPGYTVLGHATEPWGCPANVVKGPVQIATAAGDIHTIANCVFYACTANNSLGHRTANFGCSRITPWSASGWNTPLPGITMQAPLSYDTSYRYAEFDYIPAESLFAGLLSPFVNHESNLILHQSLPAGYAMLGTIPDKAWMSVVPKGLTVGTTVTGWPGTVSSPIAMVDTGGGPLFLSDPNGYVCNTTWPDPATCPAWASTSTKCNCISGSVSVALGVGAETFSYTIDESALPSSAQGLTAVMCELNAFMMGQQGMNIGGLSALFNSILIDFVGSRVGFKAKQPASV